MVKCMISFRIDKTKKDKLVVLSRYYKRAYTELIRDQIDLLLLNGVNYEVKRRAKKIIKELKTPFAYLKTKQGKARAEQEREIRNTLCKRIEAVFGL